MEKITSLIERIQDIKDEGNVVLIKFDGERESNKITVLINYPHDTNRDLIQLHGEDLLSLLSELIELHDKHD